MLGWKKLKQSFSGLREKFSRAFASKDPRELEELLISADVGASEASRLVRESGGKHEKLARIIQEILSGAEQPFTFPASPTVMMVVGTNGSGKTTTVAKLAALWKDKKVLIAAADTYRDAAGLQLERWAERTGTDLVSSLKGQDSGAVVYDAVKKAVSGGYQVVLADTAGRLHTRRDLMAEAGKIKRVCTKLIPAAPHHVLLVMDASTGQNALRQAEGFTNALGVTGLIVTKLDGTSKAGVLIPLVQRFELPIYFIGTGENPEDIASFSASEFTSALLGDRG